MSAKRPARRRGPAPQPRVEVDPSAPLVLALDSSGPVEGIAVVQGDLVLGSWSGRRPGRAGSGLVGRIHQVLEWCSRDLSQLDAVAAVTGPGAFTGLRVGIATLKGISTSLAIPSFGYSSEAAWAAGFPGATRPIAVTLDARRKEVYGALMSVSLSGDPSTLEPVRLCSPQDWFSLLEQSGACAEGVLLVGDGARLYRELAAEVLGGRFHLAGAAPAGAAVAWMARDVVRRLGDGETPAEALQPLYLRDHDAALARANGS